GSAMEGYGFIVCRRRRTVNSRRHSLRNRARAEATARPDRRISPTEDVSKRAIFSIVLELVRKNSRFFLWASLGALALRLLFVFYFPGVVDDSRLYADIA